MEINLFLNIRSSFKFVFEQISFSISSFIFLRNFLKDLNFENAGYVGIYLVASYSLMSIIRPLGLKAFSDLSRENASARLKALNLSFLIRLRVSILLAGIILSTIGFLVDTSLLIGILLPILGLLFIINDCYRFQNILSGDPEKNLLGNICVLIISLTTFLGIFQKDSYSILFLWIVSQILFFIILIAIQKNVKMDSINQNSNFTRIGKLLSLEIFLTQSLGFIFIFLLTKIDPVLSGQFRVAASAFTAIPVALFSALASQYSIKVAAGAVTAKYQVARLSVTLFAFALTYILMLNYETLGLFLSGRETKSFENGVGPAFAVATLAILISHITHSFANIFPINYYLIVRIFPTAMLYALILLLAKNNFVNENNFFLGCYLLLALFFLSNIVKKFGTEHHARE